MTILGIGDSSENDTSLTTNWQTAKNMGCQFGIVRASTTGNWVGGKPVMREDAMFYVNASNMRNAGITIFPYIWFDPRVLTGKEQAAFFLAVLTKAALIPTGTKYAIVDVEKTPTIAYNAAALLRLKECLETIKAQGWNPAIYSYPSGVDEFAGMADISWMAPYPFFNAHWDVTAPRDPWPWYPGGHACWQFTANMPGARYGFNAKAPGYSAPRICMAVM